MKKLNEDDLKELIRGRESPCITIYIPTEKAGPEIEQNKIRLKNALGKAERLLKTEGLRDREIDKILNPARDLLNKIEFWRYQTSGLAVFLSGEDTYIYHLPIVVNEFVTISHHYHVKQLLPLAADKSNFAVLTLSQKNTVLYKADSFALTAVDLGDTPSSIDDILKYDDIEQQLQHHSANAPIYHGHGGDGREERKKDILRFFQKVENAVTSYLHRENIPLLLCGQEYLIGLYRQVNSYTHILEQDVRVNPDDLPEKDLQEQAVNAIEPYFAQLCREDKEQYKRLEGTNMAVSELQKVIIAAYANRVKILFAQKDRHVYGRYDDNWHDVVFEPQDKKNNVDLINGAAVQTIIAGGKVHFLNAEEMPAKSMLAAVLRY